MLAAYSKFGNILLAGVGVMAGPLVSQNKRYTRFQAAFNEVSFNNIRDNGWYLQDHLENDIVFKPDAKQNNPIDIKTAWVIMTPGMNPLRFYTTEAWVYDTATGKCTSETVGLVGLHIVTKTPTRPQWIWSTFEQIDSIPQTGAQRPYTYNNAFGTPMPAKNPITTPTAQPCEGLPPDKCPFNVTRLHPIDPSTMETNRKYQEALRDKFGKNNVWQYYQLVMTQWPTPGNSTKSGKPENTIPGNIPVPFKGPMTSFANVTMETFEQADIKSGCMNCHNSTASDSGASTDFNWAVAMNAWSPGQPQLGTASLLRSNELAKAKQSPAIKKLIEILTQAHKDMAASPKTAKTPAKKPAKPKAKPNPSE